MRTIAATLVIIVASLNISLAQTQASPSAKRTVPPTVYLSFPKSMVVDTVYIYPTSIAFLPRSGLKRDAKLIAEFSNLYGRASYSRIVPCHYVPDDDTFWIEMPDDVPPEVSVAVKRKR